MSTAGRNPIEHGPRDVRNAPRGVVTSDLFQLISPNYLCNINGFIQTAFVPLCLCPFVPFFYPAFRRSSANAGTASLHW